MMETGIRFAIILGKKIATIVFANVSFVVSRKLDKTSVDLLV